MTVKEMRDALEGMSDENEVEFYYRGTEDGFIPTGSYFIGSRKVYFNVMKSVDRRKKSRDSQDKGSLNRHS